MGLLPGFRKRDLKKKMIMFRLLFCQTMEGKARCLKKAGIFGSMGDDCYWHPVKLPANPERVFLGNHVVVATDVYFCTHDQMRILFEGDNTIRRKDSYQPYQFQPIVVEDDVFIGAGACIMHGVRIGAHSIIAARALVREDVPSGSIVGGVPARVIGDYYDLADRRGYELSL